MCILSAGKLLSVTHVWLVVIFLATCASWDRNSFQLGWELILVETNVYHVWDLYSVRPGSTESAWDCPQTDQFSSVLSAWGKPICAPPHLSEVSPMLLLKQFQCCCFWLTMTLFQGRSSTSAFFYASLPGDWWCDVLGIVPAGCVTSDLPGACHFW